MIFAEFQEALREFAPEIAGTLQSIWSESKSDTARIKAIEVFLKYCYDKEAKGNPLSNYDNMPKAELVGVLQAALDKAKAELEEDLKNVTFM